MSILLKGYYYHLSILNHISMNLNDNYESTLSSCHVLKSHYVLFMFCSAEVYKW